GRTAPAAMRFACALLLLAADGKAGAVASALERANADRELCRFVLWLPFILDNLWHPFPGEDGLTRVAEAPDGTRWGEAEQGVKAFGWRSNGLDAFLEGSAEGTGATNDQGRPGQTEGDSESAAYTLADPEVQAGQDRGAGLDDRPRELLLAYLELGAISKR